MICKPIFTHARGAVLRKLKNNFGVKFWVISIGRGIYEGVKENENMLYI